MSLRNRRGEHSPNPGEAPVPHAAEKALYVRPASFTDLLPWVEYDPDHSTFLLEDGVGEEVARGLAELGHEVVRSDWPHGGGQAIRLHWEQGTLEAGSEPRKDGCALAY